MSAALELRACESPAAEAQPASGKSREFELLLACCTASSERALDNPNRLLLSLPLDWNRFFVLVEHHRVVPQVYRSLSRWRDLVPARVFSALHSAYVDNVRRSLRFTGELVRTLRHLEARGIKAMPYKGPALAQFLYGDVTARQYSDLDILVHPEDVSRTKAAVAALGYKPGIELTARQERDYIHSGYEYSFDGSAGDNLLELQWRVLPRFYAVDFDTSGLFERAGEVRLGGHSFRTLGAEDLLLVLCVHAAKHLWLQLSWLCDVAQLLESYELDWNRVQQQAAELGILRIVALNLRLAHELLGCALPEPSQGWLQRDSEARVLTEEIRQIIALSAHYDTESAAYFRMMMKLRERRRDRARFLWRLSTTPSTGEWSAIQLPAGLSSLYRLVRVGRLVRRFAVAIPPAR